MNKGQAAVGITVGTGLAVAAYLAYRHFSARGEALVYCPNESRYISSSQYDPQRCGIVPMKTGPGSPTGVSAIGIKSTKSAIEFDLVWTPPADTGGYPVVTYYVYVYDGAGKLVSKTYVGAVTTAHQSVAYGSRRIFGVSALNSVGEGPLSPPFDAGALVPSSEPGAVIVVA